MGKQEIVIRQSTKKVLKLLPLALLMFAGSGLLFWVSILNRNPFGLVIGVIAVAFFGPAFFILASALLRPSYLKIDDWGVTFRFYSLEMAVPWENIQEVSGGVGWPSLTFYDCQAAARTAKFSGFPPLGWLLSIPTKAVSLLLRQPLANIYPMNRKQLLQAFLANERMFRFHYGMPSDLLGRSNREILTLLKRGRPH